MKIQKTQWSVLVAGLMLLIGCSAVIGSAIRATAAADPEPAATLTMPTLAISGTLPAPSTAEVTATATREQYALTQAATFSASPTSDEGVAEPLLTLAALSGTVFNQPTPTDGPSELAQDGKPHFVDFNAGWCAPCMRMKPSIARMKAKYGDRVTFDNINVDNRASARLVVKYQVFAIPLIVLLDRDGQEVDRLEGYHTEQELDDALSALVARP
jgi:thiol-disulfide isomerase/thioredoxin